MTQAPTPGPLSTSDVKLLVKGEANGLCNRSACLAPLADEPQHQFMDGNFTGGPRLHYCEKCAKDFDKWDAIDMKDGEPRRIKREPKSLAPTAPVEASIPWQEREIEDDGKNGYRYVEPHRRPVEASGSEREVPWLTDDECDEVGKLRFALAMKVYRMSSDLKQNLRPQPSGETRALLERIAAVRARKDFTPQQANAGLLTVLDDCAAALALEGQQEDWRCPDCGAQADEWFDCCKNPARAEAQDEGATGEPVALAECPPGLFLWRGTLGFKSEYGAMEPIGSNFKTWKVGSRADAYCADSGEYFWGGTSNHADRDKVLVVPVDAASAHPSPTPAADADRVRIAVEAFNAKINAPLTGPTHGAWDRGRIAGLKEALAALKSTAAKEGGEG